MLEKTTEYCLKGSIRKIGIIIKDDDGNLIPVGWHFDGATYTIGVDYSNVYKRPPNYIVSYCGYHPLELAEIAKSKTIPELN